MIDKRLSDKPVQFEISMGNAGNTIDGQIQSAPAPGSVEARRGSGATGSGPTGSPNLPRKDELDAASTVGGLDDGK